MTHSVRGQGAGQCNAPTSRHADRRRGLWYGLWSLLVALGLLLGIWQWERAADKRDYLERLATAPHLDTPREVPPEGARVTLEGEYLAEQTLYLDNRTRNRELGVAVLTPLRDEEGRLWLVQRGFLATGPSRDTPDATTPKGRVRVSGRWQAAGEAAPLYGPNREGKRLQRIDLAAWQEWADFAHDGWLHLDSGDGAYPSWWEPSVMPPSRHVGYAVQWWGLALTALVVMAVGGRRLGTPRGDGKTEAKHTKGEIEEECPCRSR